VTLIEILIVVAIITMISGGIAAAVFPYFVDSQRKATAVDAHTIRAAVRAWWLTHDPVQCPDFDELVKSGALDEGSPRRDAWGEPWQIQCAGGAVSVVSAGQDRQLDTADDIRAPAPPAT